MINKAEPKRLMTQYLLGELPAADCAELEDLYLNDTELFQELVATENEMIDKYVLGELSRTQREKFSNAYMTNPARRELVETAKSLLAISAGEIAGLSPAIERKAKRRYRRWMGLAAAVLGTLICGVSWLLVVNHRMKDEIQKLQHEQAALLQEKKMLQEQGDQLRADLRDRDNALQQIEQSIARDTISFTLGAGASRGNSEADRLVIPSTASYVLLRMVLEGEAYPRYSVSLSTAEGSPIWRQSNIKGRRDHDGTEIAIKLPARLFLPDHDYVIRVSRGSEDLNHTLAGYGFHILRR